MFLKELEAELKKVKGTRSGARKWDATLLLRTVVEVGSISQNHKGVNPRWPVPLAILVSVYRGESAKITAVDSYNLSLASAGPAPDEDDGDFD